MSAIYFHSEEREARIRGNERAFFGHICTDMLLMSLIGVINPISPEKSDILFYLPRDSYARKAPTEFSIETYLTSLMGGSVIVDDETYDTFSLALNTALIAGSNAIKLGARLHGQCEIHTFVRGENRAWLADLITQGRRTNIFRAEMGWEEVITLLLESNSGPVVTSYSVCDGFPNANVADWEGEYDDWYDISDEDQWERGVAGLYKKNEDHTLEISPESWDSFYFRSGMNGFKLAEIISSREDDRAK